MRTNAAGFLVATEAEQGPVNSPAEVVNDTTASGGKAVIFKPEPVIPPPTPPTGAMMGWQVNTQTVGLAPHGLTCDSLPEYKGPDRVPAGTTVSKQRITKSIDLVEGNITLEKSCIKPFSADFALVFGAFLHGEPNGPAKGPITVRDSEIDGSRLSAHDQAYTDGFKGLGNLYRNYIHHVGSGIALVETGKNLSAIIENNYVTELKSWNSGPEEPNHSDAFTVRDFNASSGRTLAVRNNRFNCAGGNESGAFFIQTTFGVIGNVTAEGNLLEGGGYQLVLNAKDGVAYSNMKAINNRMTNTGYGSASVQAGVGWSVWTDNFVYDASKPDAKGASIAKPSVE